MIDRQAGGDGDGRAATPEWQDFRENLVEHRKRLERTLRRELVHDPRAARVRLANVAVPDLADDALCEALDDWRGKPAGTTPYQWMLKRALRLLDQTLDREALAAESRAEERLEEGRLRAHDVLQDDEERRRWLDVADLARRSARRDAPQDERTEFDGLTSSPDTSSPAERLEQAETLVELERALLRLPEQARRIVAHRFLDGLDDEEIAFLLDLPRERVRDEAHAALATLRAELGSA